MNKTFLPFLLLSTFLFIFIQMGAVSADSHLYAPWPTATPKPRTTPTPTRPANTAIPYKDRFGVLGSPRDLQPAINAGLKAGTFMTWDFTDKPNVPAGMKHWQMVRVNKSGPVRGYAELEKAIRANKGAIWAIGNEPDVIWQDNLTADQYAKVYHELYTFIKQKDPKAVVAFGGFSTMTPLRRQYVDWVLKSYERQFGKKLSADMWAVHSYVLREERGSWGVDIPPGMNNVQKGQLYEIEDHKNPQIAQALIREFRAFMNSRGYRQLPLVITEFGILMPPDYGFEPAVVSDYMKQMINYQLNAVDSKTGYSKDGNKLVQYWFWFTLVDDGSFEYVSDLYDPTKKSLTLMGKTYSAFLNR